MKEAPMTTGRSPAASVGGTRLAAFMPMRVADILSIF
jgi:hypothetical protein